MTVVPPALPCRACNKCLKESHEFTCLLLAKADMRVDQSRKQACGSCNGAADQPSGGKDRAAQLDGHALFEIAQIGLCGKLRYRFGYRLGGCWCGKPAASNCRASFNVSNGIAISVQQACNDRADGANTEDRDRAA